MVHPVFEQQLLTFELCKSYLIGEGRSHFAFDLSIQLRVFGVQLAQMRLKAHTSLQWFVFPSHYPRSKKERACHVNV
jgi:hypothetical protein